MILRKANIDDCRFIFDLSNDPVVRANSFSTIEIKWEDHINWFKKQLNSDNKIFLIICEDDETSIGQVRFDVTGRNNAKISLSLLEKVRGRGLGSKVIRMSTKKTFSETKVERVEAWVKKDNAASLKTFEKSGYMKFDEIEDKGIVVLEAVKESRSWK